VAGNRPATVVMEEIFVPASGMAMEDVLFTEWLKQPGDEVAAGDGVAVVETDKSTIELSSTTAGRLSGHLVAVGERVLGGATVAYVLKEGRSHPQRSMPLSQCRCSCPWKPSGR